MFKKFFPAVSIILLLSSCTAIKPLNFTSSKQVATVSAPAPDSKFIEDISVTPKVVAQKTEIRTLVKKQTVTSNSAKVEAKKEVANVSHTDILANRVPEVESASAVELKYAVLMDMEVESLPSKSLLDAVDEWYGVRYRSGGNTHSGVDCSGFTVAVYAVVYGLTLPRVSRDQYKTCRKISTTELQEGDLVFFNTNGRGVSHVGIYLGNNKFIHASVSRGVRVSDLFETYYMKRFVGAGRMDEKGFISRIP